MHIRKRHTLLCVTSNTLPSLPIARKPNLLILFLYFSAQICYINLVHCLPEAIVIQGLIFLSVKIYLTGGEQMKLYPL